VSGSIKPRKDKNSAYLDKTDWRSGG
jgi:hypothetical protein